MRPLRVCLPVEVLAFSLAVLFGKTGGSLLSDFGGVFFHEMHRLHWVDIAQMVSVASEPVTVRCFNYV